MGLSSGASVAALDSTLTFPSDRSWPLPVRIRTACVPHPSPPSHVAQMPRPPPLQAPSLWVQETCPRPAFSEALISPSPCSLKALFHPPIPQLRWFHKAGSSTALRNNL